MQSRALRHALATLAAALCLLSLTADAAHSLCTQPGDHARDFTLTDLQGNPVALSDYDGKVVMMVFWASWCSRCREEMEFLQDLSSRLADDVVVLAINQETENVDPAHLEKLRADVAQMGLEFPVLLDTDLQVWGAYCVNALPTSIIVGRQGQIAFAEPNYYWASQDNLTAALRDLDALHD
ncbi:MAG: TlpA disulfide reductase family protein [Deferrisomatales bacterium]|nr:TlpA disulfide reductase family protein [Deferrisomatales bacterium]